MPFKPEQIDQLNAPLSRADVKMRDIAGRKVSYIESWHAIAEANRVFGFDGWSSHSHTVNCVSAKEVIIAPTSQHPKPGWSVSYVAMVRITVHSGDTLINREGWGAGHGINQDLGQAHESAIKEAESDAQKRAFRMFGNVFGLALYDKTQENVVDEVDATYQRFIAETKNKIEAATPGVALLNWWNSDEEKRARRNFDVTPADLIVLKNLVTEKMKPK